MRRCVVIPPAAGRQHRILFFDLRCKSPSHACARRLLLQHASATIGQVSPPARAALPFLVAAAVRGSARQNPAHRAPPRRLCRRVGNHTTRGLLTWPPDRRYSCLVCRQHFLESQLGACVRRRVIPGKFHGFWFSRLHSAWRLLSAASAQPSRYHQRFRVVYPAFPQASGIVLRPARIRRHPPLRAKLSFKGIARYTRHLDRPHFALQDRGVFRVSVCAGRDQPAFVALHAASAWRASRFLLLLNSRPASRRPDPWPLPASPPQALLASLVGDTLRAIW